jgi:hypothetical protein
MTLDPTKNMKWEVEKAKIQYNTEVKAMRKLVGKLLHLNKDLYDINAGRNQYHKE